MVASPSTGALWASFPSGHWLRGYLQRLRADHRFLAARDQYMPLWLVEQPAYGEDGSGQERYRQQRVALTIEHAVERHQTMVISGAPGAGKSMLVRRLALDLAEAALMALERPATSIREQPLIPLYISAQLLRSTFDEVLVALGGEESAPGLEQLASAHPLMLIFDGLSDLPAQDQLANLAMLSEALNALGPQGRSILTCRSQDYQLFRPWVGAKQVLTIRDLDASYLRTWVERRVGQEQAAAVLRDEDIRQLARRPRWLAALGTLLEERPEAALNRGLLLDRWVDVVLQELARGVAPAAEPHAVVEQMRAVIARIGAPPYTLAINTRSESLTTEPGPLTAAQIATMLTSMDILAGNRQQLNLTQRQLSHLASASAIQRGLLGIHEINVGDSRWSEALVLLYGFTSERGRLLEQILERGALNLAARALSSTHEPAELEQALQQVGPLLPDLRLALATALERAGHLQAAIQQLERAIGAGRDHAAVHFQIGELASRIEDWARARVGFEAAAMREPHNVLYRQRLGVACSRLGESEEAATRLQEVLREQHQLYARGAHELGHVYMQQGRTQMAMEEYARAAALQPDEAEYHRSLGRSQRLLGQHIAAQKTLERAIQLNHDDAGIHAELGMLYLDLPDFQRGLQHFEQAAELDPSSAEVQRQLGTLRFTLGDEAGARESLQRAVELDPRNPQGYVLLGEVYEAQGQAERAASALRQAVRLNERSESNQRRLGRLLRLIGRSEEAEATLRRAIELAPDEARNHNELARILWQQQRWDAALDEYRWAASLQPEDPEHQHALGMAYRQMMETQHSPALLSQAAQHLGRAAELAPDRAPIQYDLAGIHEALGHTEEALQAYTRAAALAPTQIDYLKALARLLLRLQRHAQVRPCLAHALHQAPKDAELHHLSGRMHAAEGRVRRALAALRRALLWDCNNVQIYLDYARLLKQLDMAAESIAAYETALRLDPSCYQARSELSQALTTMGDDERALSEAREAARQAPQDANLQEVAGILARRCGRLNEALQHFDRALALDPHLLGALIERSRVQLTLNRPAEAVESSATACELAPDDSEARLQHALCLMAVGRDEQAQQQLQRATTLDPALGQAYSALRDLYLKRGQLDLALQVAQQAARLAPEDASMHAALGTLLRKTSRIDEACRSLERALELDPESAQAHAELCALHCVAERWDAAISAGQRAVYIDPETAEHHYWLARALRGAGEFAAATHVLKTAISRSEERASWHHELGMIHLSMGQKQEALLALQRAVELDPTNARYAADLGSCLRLCGDAAGASSAFEAALRLAPQQAAWRLELGSVYASQSWYHEALAEFEGVLEQEPDHPEALLRRGSVLLKLGKQEEARCDIERVVAMRADDAEAFVRLAETLLAVRQWERAFDAAKQAIKLDPQRHEAFAFLAQALRKRGDTTGAISALEKALRLAPNSADYIAQLASDYEAIGELPAARFQWGRLIELEPTHLSARLHLGRILARLGGLDQAQSMLETVLSVDPGNALAAAELARLHARAGRDEQAISAAEQVVQIKPNDVAAWRELGTMRKAHGQPDLAAEALRRALELQPLDAESAFQLGQIALDQSELKAAQRHFSIAVEQSPQNADYHGFLGLTLRRPADPEPGATELTATPEQRPALQQALAAFEEAIRLAPHSARWWCELGTTRLRLGEAAAGRETLEHAASLLDEHATELRGEINLNLAMAHWQLGDERAEQAIAQALEATPQDHRALYYLSLIAQDNGNIPVAYSAIERAAGLAATQPVYQLQLGRNARLMGDHDTAIAALERAVDCEPQNGDFHYELSVACASAQRRDRAIIHAERATQLTPNNAEYLYHLGTLYAEGGRHREAAVVLQRALSMLPGQASWHALLGRCERQQGRIAQAQSALQRALERDPSNAEYALELAEIAQQRGERPNAISALERAVQHLPDRPDLLAQLGQLYEEEGRADEARQSTTKAIQLNPNDLGYWRSLARQQRRQGAYEAAIETLERALISVGQHAELHGELGRVYELMNKPELALSHFQLAANLDAKDASYLWCAGELMLRLGERENSKTLLERAIQIDPSAAQAYYLLSRLYEQENNMRLALAYGRKAADLVPQDVRHQLQVANVCTRLQWYEEALVALEQAIALQRDEPQIYLQRGKVYLELGQQYKALDDFERAILLQPEDATGYYLAGLAHRSLKQYSKAVDRLRRAVKLRPGYSDAIRELSLVTAKALFSRRFHGDRSSPS